jgi:hypothetical protein
MSSDQASHETIAISNDRDPIPQVRKERRITTDSIAGS